MGGSVLFKPQSALKVKGLSSWKGHQQAAGLQQSLRRNTQFSRFSESLRNISDSCLEPRLFKRKIWNDGLYKKWPNPEKSPQEHKGR